MSSPMAWRQSRPMVSLVSGGKRPVADPVTNWEQALMTNTMKHNYAMKTRG